MPVFKLFLKYISRLSLNKYLELKKARAEPIVPDIIITIVPIMVPKIAPLDNANIMPLGKDIAVKKVQISINIERIKRGCLLYNMVTVSM